MLNPGWDRQRALVLCQPSTSRPWCAEFTVNGKKTNKQTKHLTCNWHKSSKNKGVQSSRFGYKSGDPLDQGRHLDGDTEKRHVWVKVSTDTYKQNNNKEGVNGERWLVMLPTNSSFLCCLKEPQWCCWWWMLTAWFWVSYDCSNHQGLLAGLLPAPCTSFWWGNGLFKERQSSTCFKKG